MRILLLLIITLALVGTSTAQIFLNKNNDASKGYYRTYYMPDGAVLKGRVVGRLAKDSVIVESRDGLIYHLSSAEARKTGKVFAAPIVVEETVVNEEVDVDIAEPELPFKEQPNFLKGSSQLGADLITHFSSGGSAAGSDPESGIVFSASYLYGVSSQLKVGGGVGLMTVKSGSKERAYPVFVRAEYQLLPKISATVSAGYSIIPTNDFVLDSQNGVFGNAGVSFDLVGPESAYTSRIGIGMVAQQLDLGRTEIIRENGFGSTRIYTQYIQRSGLMRRVQITFTHAWRMRPATSLKGKSKRKKRS